MFYVVFYHLDENNLQTFSYSSMDQSRNKFNELFDHYFPVKKENNDGEIEERWEDPFVLLTLIEKEDNSYPPQIHVYKDAIGEELEEKEILPILFSSLAIS